MITQTFCPVSLLEFVLIDIEVIFDFSFDQGIFVTWSSFPPICVRLGSVCEISGLGGGAGVVVDEKKIGEEVKE